MPPVGETKGRACLQPGAGSEGRKPKWRVLSLKIIGIRNRVGRASDASQRNIALSRGEVGEISELLRW
jgi:hypothetical protein